MSKIARVFHLNKEIQKIYKNGVLQKLFFDWKKYIGEKLNIEKVKGHPSNRISINGKVYQNLYDMKNLTYDYYDTFTEDGYKNINIPELSTGYKVCKSAVNNLIKANTVYTIIIDVRKNTYNKNFGINSDYGNEGYFSKNIAIQQKFTGRMVVTATSKETLPSKGQKVFRTQITPDSLGEIEFKLMLLEGDLSQETITENSIEYLEEGASELRNLTIRGKTYQNLVSNLDEIIGKVYTRDNVAIIDSTLFKANTTYTAMVTISESSYSSEKYGAIFAVFYPTLTNSYAGISLKDGTFKLTFITKEETPIKIQVGVQYGNSATSSFKLNNLIILEGNYTNIDLPTNIDGIESVAERERNLVNTTTIYESMLESGTIGSLFKPKSNSAYDAYKMEIQPNTEYLFNLVRYGQTPWVRILDKNNIIVKAQSLTSTGVKYIWSLKTESNFYYLVFNKPKTSTGEFKIYKKQNPYPLKLKINEENNYINLPIPLRSLPNGTCDTIEGNKLVQRVGKVVLDGSADEAWNNDGTQFEGYYSGAFDTIKNIKKYACLISNEFKYNKSNTLKMEYIFPSGAANKGIRIRISNDKATDVSSFREWLSKNPTTVYYELAEPVETQLDLPTITIKEGTNLITTTNNITPQIELDCLVRDKFQNMCPNTWVNGDIAVDSGVEYSSSSSRVKLKDYIQVQPNTTYYCDTFSETVYSTSGKVGVRYYKNDKTYIRGRGGGIGTAKTSYNKFTTPKDCYYIKFIVETLDTNYKMYLRPVKEMN